MPQRMTAREFRALTSNKARRNKFNAKRTTDAKGRTFASGHECRSIATLELRLRAGEITSLVLQPRYALSVNGRLVGHYTADARYQCAKTGRVHVVDAKSPATMTTDAKLRIRLFEACYPGIVVEFMFM